MDLYSQHGRVYWQTHDPVLRQYAGAARRNFDLWSERSREEIPLGYAGMKTFLSVFFAILAAAAVIGIIGSFDKLNHMRAQTVVLRA